jgi:gliding motility-associated transport system permease protein
MIAIFKRELKAYFLSPIGYIFMSLFLLVGGVLFSFGNLVSHSSEYSGFLGSILFMFLLTTPVLTMRLFSDEIRMKTDQLLLTSPMRITEIVLGKYLAALVVFLITLVITVFYAILVAVYGDLDVWQTVGGYIGFLLMGCSFIAVGMFVSATTENQVVAAIITFAALLLAYVMDAIQSGVPTDQNSGIIFAAVIVLGVAAWIYFSTRHLIITGAVVAVGAIVIILFFLLNKSVYVGFIGNVLAWFSLMTRYRDFTNGLLKLNSIIYYLSFSGFFVFLTVRLIEKRRWS